MQTLHRLHHGFKPVQAPWTVEVAEVRRYYHPAAGAESQRYLHLSAQGENRACQRALQGSAQRRAAAADAERA